MIVLSVHPNKIYVSQSTKVFLRLTNKGTGTCTSIQLSFRLSPGILIVAGKSRLPRIAYLEEGKHYDYQLCLKASQEGNYHLCSTNFTYLDPLGRSVRPSQLAVTIQVLKPVIQRKEVKYQLTKFQKTENKERRRVKEPSMGTEFSRDKGNRMIKILFLASNPLDTGRLRLDEEMKSIDNALRQADFGRCFDPQQQWAVGVEDIQSHLLRHQPDIVHFCGHGSKASEILLRDRYGNSHPVSANALTRLFSVLKDNIRCVVLNACYSEKQARAIAQSIDFVVGMSRAIGDSDAISFATAFYQALGFGRDMKTAFESGCLQLGLENSNDQDTPKLLSRIDPASFFYIDKKRNKQE